MIVIITQLVVILPQCVQMASGVQAVRKPARPVRMAVCVTNTTGRATVLQGSWADSARTVSISRVFFFFFEGKFP